VAVIERRDLGEPQALRYSDHRGADDAQREIQVGLHELGHPVDVLAFELSDVEAVAGERSEEGGFACGPTRDCSRYQTSPSRARAPASPGSPNAGR
jgi:hypothetical protein